MKFFRKLRNYFCYCGIEKEEYNSIKKNAYISNFEVWRVLHFLMAAAFGVAFAISMFDQIMAINKIVYGVAFGYSILVISFFFFIKKDSLVAQLLIYLSISVLLLFGAFVSSNSKNLPAVSFIAFLLITPIFMIDKPYFIAIELVAASLIFNVWMYLVKPIEIWRVDLVNTIAFTIISIFIHIISSSLRIKEFVLIKKINLQKDIDDLTGLKNKSCLTREINAYIERDTEFKQGIFFVLDIDRFKEFNDTYGHDVGDEILKHVANIIKDQVYGRDYVIRWGGEEFVVILVDYRIDQAMALAEKLRSKIENSNNGICPITISVGVYRYNKNETYHQAISKADQALYKAKELGRNQVVNYKDIKSA
jgi:diguanylate cyclase (GGDEF)-like protein